MSLSVGVHTHLTLGFGTTLTTTGITTQATGSFIVVFVHTAQSGQAPTSLVDNKGNTYSLITSDNQGGFGSTSVFAYGCANAAGGSGHTFTPTVSAASRLGCYAVEIIGAPASAAVQASAIAFTNSTSTAVTGAAVATAAANQLVLSFVGTNQQTASAYTITNGGGIWTILESEVNGATLTPAVLSYAIPTTAGTYNDTYTISPADYSDAIAISIKIAPTVPTITAQPAWAVSAVGGTASFSVSATPSGGSLSYLWYKNGVSIGGATSSTYTTPTVASGDNASKYYCAVTDSNGTVNTVSAYLFVSGLIHGQGGVFPSGWMRK